MATNAERFLNAYVSIEKALNVFMKTDSYVPYSVLITRASHSNRIVRSHIENLREYGELRNAIVHQRGTKQEIIAEPSDSVTEDIERIAALMTRDDHVLIYASKPVITVAPDKDVSEAFQIMESMDTSKLPVYEGASFSGLVTMKAIAARAIRSSVADMTVRQIMDTEEKQGKVLFLGRDRSVQEAVQGFEDSMNQGAQLQAVLITETGSLHEKPLGILTVKDLPKILKELL